MCDKLTDKELAAIAARAEAVMSGRWYARLDDKRPDWYMVFSNMGYVDVAHVPPWAGYTPQNAEFIAHARTDIPALLDHIDALKAKNKRLREALAALVSASENRSHYEAMADDENRWCVICRLLEDADGTPRRCGACGPGLPAECAQRAAGRR